MRIHKDDTTALIVDIQERLFPHIFEHEQIAQNTSILIQGLQLLNIPTIVTQQYTKGLGSTIPSIQQVLDEPEPVEKISFSCCDDEGFMKKLNDTGRKSVLIAGIESHICVQQTTLDLLDNGFIPIVIEDCVSSRKAHDKHIAIDRMRTEGAIITTYESILFELCRFAGNDTFKSISKLVK